MKKILNKFRSAPKPQPVTGGMIHMLHALKLHDGVTHAHLAWTNLPSMPETVQAVTYLAGNYPTREKALQAQNDFVSTLPSSVSPVHSERFLWALVEPVANVIFTPESRLIDLTETSRIQQVKTLVDALPEFAKTDLSFVAATGTIDNVNAPKLSFELMQVHPAGTKLVYQFRNWEWKDWEAFNQTLAPLRDITKSDLETLRVRLHVTDSTKFTLKDDKRVPIKTVHIDYRAPQAPARVAALPPKKELIARVAKPQRKNQIPVTKAQGTSRPVVRAKAPEAPKLIGFSNLAVVPQVATSKPAKKVSPAAAQQPKKTLKAAPKAPAKAPAKSPKKATPSKPKAVVKSKTAPKKAKSAATPATKKVAAKTTKKQLAR